MDTVDAKQFEAYRPLMFSIAYRMRGSVTEAEDIVQEPYLRYQATPPDQIVSHKAYLSTIITRLCLNRLQSARAQRDAYIGPWQPEPVLTCVDERFTPLQQAELHDGEREYPPFLLDRGARLGRQSPSNRKSRGCDGGKQDSPAARLGCRYTAGCPR